ncbi:MICOS complex subunit Mic10-like [Drosophila grimshawi]|uniref:MICOS complex subunit Mic10-like n=1 Tax=Drosophila grimshawi TaxID=7222 RepID=UPI000C86EF27|nr:MICOS complex subunit Mic10-like [Drosophila grimshawi]
MTFSEDQVGVKLDRCVSDTIIKGSGGLLIGSVMSLLFFKRRVWPVWLGSGFGVGVAYSTCEKNLNSSK